MRKFGLLLGFLAVSIAIITAYINPATGYELSIYPATPLPFWVFSSFALLISILVVFLSADRSMRMAGIFLGGMTMTTIVALPIIRGYHYVGEGDALSHLGTAKDMNAGLLALSESSYPIVHPLGSVLHDATGLALNHVMLVVIVVFVVCYFVFVPLVVRELTGSSLTASVGFFSGLLLLPLNHISPSLHIHPTSQALMYAPVFLFAFFVLYRRRTARHSSMFLLLATMFVLLHPQQAANLVIFFGMIAAMQIGNDVLRGDSGNRRHEWVLPEVMFYATVFVLWAMNTQAFWNNIETVIMIPFEGQVARSTATRSVSLAEVGGTLPEVFVKLFLVSCVFVLLTGFLLVLIFNRSRVFESRPGHDTIAPDGGTDQMLPWYIYGGLVGVTLIFLLYLIGGISDQYFRHLGMLMVLATILGVIALGQVMQYISQLRSKAVARRSVMLVLVLFTVLSLPVVFPSPYIYNPSNQVTEMQFSGFETTFEHQSDTIVFDEVRSKVYRYGHAIQGKDTPEEAYYSEDRERHGIPDHFANHQLRRYFDEPTYVPVTEADRTRDPILWNGFRFSHEDFAYLDSERGINKLQSNGGYDLYLVEPENASSN